MTTNFERVKSTADSLLERVGDVPQIAMILGSGLGALAEELEDAVGIDYAEIDGFPVSAVVGHHGRLVFGKLEQMRVVVMQGRAHYYEGWSAEDVTFPVRTFGLMGIPRMLVTNAAGGIHPSFQPGDLMLITDHLNLTGYNPLRGPNDDRFGTRFPDMSAAYSHEMRQTIVEAARQANVPLKAGVYAGVIGPSYETPAEVRMIGKLGGDAVGMSTVPEVIVANHMGISVGGISCISNLAAGISEVPLDHSEVEEVAGQVRATFAGLVKKTVSLLGNKGESR